MTWIYEVASHTFTNSKTHQSYMALYSGAVGYKNDSSKERVKKHGPLPRGSYTIQAPTSRKPHLGPYALELTPNIGNHMYGRSSFYIHGDNKKNPGHASEGCIVASPVVRHAIWESKDTELEVR